MDKLNGTEKLEPYMARANIDIRISNEAMKRSRCVQAPIVEMKCRCFRPPFCTMKAELGRGQFVLMRLNFYEIFPRTVSNPQDLLL